ncbi:MAG: hypothetical protein WCR29_05050 [Bacteroidales bacterium]|nr:hypothetical protein [Bacteroidales bacterium]
MKKLILLVFAFAIVSLGSVQAQTPVKKAVKHECSETKKDKDHKKDAGCCSGKDGKQVAKKDHECCQDKAAKDGKKHDCCQDKVATDKSVKPVKQAVKK